MIVRPVSRLIQELDAVSFSVIGSPGSDGLGPEAFQVYATAIAEAEGDFLVTLGDVAPLGQSAFYKYTAEFLDRFCDKPMHVVPGGFDLAPEFEEHFGSPNRAVLSEHFVLLMLDNSRGSFSDDALGFLRDTLAIVESRNIIVAFHTPPPNRFSGDSIAAEEWNRFEDAVGVWRKRISLLVCGHGNCYYEDEVDGLRLVVTGGGGARLRELDRTSCPEHHILEFTPREEGRVDVRYVPLRTGGKADRLPEIRNFLEDAFAGECREHVDRLLQAEEADRRGFPNLATLLRAAAESRLRCARNLRKVLEKTGDPRAAAATAAEEPEIEREELLGDVVAAADMAQDPVAAHALRTVALTGSAQVACFSNAAQSLEADLDAEEATYHVCASCGLLLPGYDVPDHCPQCGAPRDMIREAGKDG